VLDLFLCEMGLDASFLAELLHIPVRVFD
jgi:hypothetical protein